MTIAISNEGQELSKVARSFLASAKAIEESRALLDANEDRLPSFWSQMAELGWLGLHVAERFGGGGFGLPELAIVVEALGGSMAPGPFVPTVIASSLLSSSGSESQRADLLPGLADGTLIAGIGVNGTARIEEGVIAGSAGVVLGAELADIILVAMGEDVLVVPRSVDGVVVKSERNLDPTRRSAHVSFDQVQVDDGAILVGAGPVLVSYARALIAAEAAGGARACLDAAVAYAKERRQFGRIIGTFGPVKHHCADMLIATETATALAWNAARAAGADRRQFALASAAACAVAVPAFHQNSQMNIQVHGGIGFTWEHDAHLFLRRASVLASIADPTAAADHVTTLAESGVTPVFTPTLPPEAKAIRTEIRSLVKDVTLLTESERAGALLDAGLTMPHWPKPWGRDAKAVEQLVIDQELQRADITRPRLGITGWILMTLIQHGTKEQVERWVRPALEGRTSWCQLFSEPDAGSDAAAIRTRGIRVDGGWSVTGEKVWTSGAHEAQFGLATVRTNTEVPKHRGITTMVIDMAKPGVEVRPLREATGSALFNEEFFDEVFVPDEDVVGAVDEGWTVVRSTIGNERVTIGSGEGLAIGIDPIKAWNHRTTTVPGARARVGKLLAEGQAIQAMNLRRTERAVIGAILGPEGNVTKLFSAEHGQRSLDLAMQLLGPEAAVSEGFAGEVSRLYIFARQNSIGGGTSEISRNQIGERILGLPRDPLLS